MNPLLVGLAIALATGFLCRVFRVPLPAPPTLAGALLVVTITLGYAIGAAVAG